MTFVLQFKKNISHINRQFPSLPRPLYQNEVKRLAFDMDMIFHSNANKIHFHRKGCALGLVLKVRVFGTQKWPIGLLTKLKHGAHIHQSRPGHCFTHAHSHITWAGAAMHSCFALIGAHQHGIAVGSMNGQIQESAKHSFKRQLYTRLWKLLTRRLCHADEPQ